MSTQHIQRIRMQVAGQVQGVGFRPYVYRLARSLQLTGFVINDSGGAAIEVQGPPPDLEAFARRLPAELPPLAAIRRCRSRRLPCVEGEGGFDIRASAGGEMTDAQVTVDTATCADCLRELADPADPRHRYPFINCTNCGPRYSIIKRIPYDRPNTTMADFAMCPLCAAQYTDPGDRRFHAQPVACPKCGPSCWLVDDRGKQILCDDPIAAAAGLIADGKIVAVKGLGGFHLACRADDEHTVRRLRLRKQRDAKPFALMVGDLAQGRLLCEIDPAAERLLTGPLRPIVLLRRLPAAPVARAVAPGLDALGLMLPYTPLHHLLFETDGPGEVPGRRRRLELPPLVMTSGNVSDEPLVKDNDDAVAHLGRIADAILLHNRRIQRSLDDSVVQHRRPRPVVFRRARGYAPQPVAVAGAPDAQAGPILAVGAELRNTVCIYRAGRAVLSEHIGDLKDGRTYRRFMQVINDLEALFDAPCEAIVADLHPQYLSTEYAMRRSAGQLAGRPALPLVRVQHHHAHVVACMAENSYTGEVIGLSCDGTGYGLDGAVWGCEVLRCSPTDFRRLGHLRYFALPGGDAAAVETARPAVSLLLESFGPGPGGMQLAGRLFEDRKRLSGLLEQIAAGVNCPPTSSLGRLFDAVAALCGLARANEYEGQAPMALEAAADRGVDRTYQFALTDGEPFTIDYRAMIKAVVADLNAGRPVGTVSAKFHNTVAAFLAAAAVRARQITKLNVVALSGGCFANRYVSARLSALLRRAGFGLLTHRRIPCNDGGVALGQAVVAAHRLAAQRGARQRRTQNVPGHTRED